MAQFPFKQADIMALANEVLAGLTANPAIYPAPPIDLADFAAAIDLFDQKDAAFIQANAAKEMATTERQKALTDIKDKLKKQLRYAENTVSFDDTKLNMLGWAGKHAKTSAAPGQILELKATEQATDHVVLSWIAPADGGKPLAYKILRRDGQDSNTWINAGISMTTTVKLTDQPRHIDLEYKVIALNKTGEGPESNTVSVVL